MKEKLSLLLLLFSVFAFTANAKFGERGPGIPSYEWWNQNWHYRIPIEVKSGGITRVDEPIELIFNFASLFSIWGISGTLDVNSVRVIDQGEAPKEVLSQFDPMSGEIVWLSGEMRANTSKKYYVYFDIMENGPKPAPAYYDSLEDGGILVLHSRDDVSVIYKIEGSECETARLNAANGDICFLKPPFGTSLIEQDVSSLGFVRKERTWGEYQEGKHDAAKVRLVSITGGPVRYRIVFQNEPDPPNCSLVSSEISYTFYYVPSGHEIRAKLENTRIVFRGFFPQDHPDKWTTAFGIKEMNGSAFCTAFLAADIDRAALYDITDSWGTINICLNSPVTLSDNFWGVYGENGVIGIIPVDPAYKEMKVEGYKNRDFWTWSVINESLVDFIETGTYRWVFWICSGDMEGWSQAQSFGDRIEEPIAVEVTLDYSLPDYAGHSRVFEIEQQPNRRDTSYLNPAYDIIRRFRDIHFKEDESEIAWLDDSWGFRRSHSIGGSTTGAQSDYPIRIVVHFASGVDSGEDIYLGSKCRTDFGDIRFTKGDGLSQLDYWIEKKKDGEEAVFWVELDSIPASPDEATFYIYYGRSDITTTSDGKSTFDWFDEFKSDSSDDYNLGRHVSFWHGLRGYRPYYDPLNERVAFDTGNDLTGGWMVKRKNLNIQNFAAKVVFGVTGSYLYNTTNGILGRWLADDSFYGFSICGGHYPRSPALIRDQRVTYVSIPSTNTYHPLDGTPFTMELRIFDRHLTGIYNEGEFDEVALRGTNSTHREAGQVGFIVSQAIGWFDVFFVRKYIEPEPSHASWGREEVPLFPPIAINLERKINRSLFKIEAFHTISWAPHPKNRNSSIVNYRIYRKEAGQGDVDYQLIGTVQSDTFEYVDGYLDASKKFVYALTAMDSNGQESIKSSGVSN